jgi:hypothetical protein
LKHTNKQRHIEQRYNSSQGLSLLAAKLVVKPENRRFSFGYSHVVGHCLNVAKAEGVADPRRQGRSCIGIPRALDNKGDAAPSAFPKGKKQGEI